MIAEMGIAVMDSDAIYRSLSAKGSVLLEELCGFFGEHILDLKGNLDRGKLSELVFGDDIKLENLNRITHKHILSEVLRQAREVYGGSRGGLVVVQAPLLFESGFDKHCAFTVCVIADDQSCIKRIMVRDSLTEEQAGLRLSKQKSNSFLQKECDYSIFNNTDVAVLREQTERVFYTILGEKEYDKA